MTITLTREEAQQVLGLLVGYENSTEDFRIANRCIALIETLRARLAQPEQFVPLSEYKKLQDLVTSQGIRLMEYESQPEPEPVGEVLNERGEVDYISYVPPAGTPLYTAPPQRVYCSCGDGIVPDDGALCGTCVSLKDAVKQEPVAWHEPGSYSNVTVYKKWAEENRWLPLYEEKNK